MYDLQGQGIPLVFPIDQQAVVDAIQTETNLSTSLYSAMGKDIKDLQKKIAGEISRGLSTGMMYSEMARNIASWARIPKNNAMRIARTEAHRIQCKAAYDAQYKAKSKGADVVKQWDSTLDGKTRDSHRVIDGEIKELDEKFSNGLEYPGDPSGRPEEVINCRCALLQRARWALDRTETKYLGKMEGMTDEELKPLADKLHISVDKLRTYQGQIVPINARNYDDFKKKYNQIWHYEGSNLQKEAEARIAGYKNKKAANYYVRDHAGAKDTANERAVLDEAISSLPKKVQDEIEKGTIFDIGKTGASQYNYFDDILYIAKGATKSDVIHEIGHMVENKMIDSQQLAQIRKKLVGNPSFFDFKTEIYYDTSGNPHEIFILENDNFISQYQGRIYVENIFDAFDKKGNFKDDLLWEFLSEPFREYMYEPDNLKAKCAELYELIDGAVK